MSVLSNMVVVMFGSGGLKISISSWMYNLSIYFNCILVLANISYST